MRDYVRETPYTASSWRAVSTTERKRFARLNLDPATVCWNRVVDLNDRFLCKVQIGHGAQVIGFGGGMGNGGDEATNGIGIWP